MKNSIHSFLSVGLFFSICALYLYLAINHPIAYIWATYEDLPGEWAQFYLFFFAMIFSIRHAALTSQYRWFFIILAIACFYTIMEEISWGQRLFGWEASDFFKKNNLQGETNLHNMFTGPYSTLLKKSLEYILAVGLTVYGLIYPLLLKYKWKMAIWFEAKGLPVLPLYLAPFFVTAAYLELGPLSFNEAEIAEVLVGLGLCLMALHYLHYSQIHIRQQEDKEVFSHSLSLSYRIVNIIFMVIFLSTATTFSLYATEDGKRRTDRRINNGIEKFISRYKNYNNWEMVILLSKKLLKKSPSNQWTLRNLAIAYRKLGNINLSDKYLDKAIKKDLAILKEKPWKASTNRSLVHSYRIKEDSINSEKHLSKALENGLNHIEEHPYSTNAMYSLGKTYIMMNKIAKARPLFIKAYQLKPTDKDFRKKYYKYQ